MDYRGFMVDNLHPFGWRAEKLGGLCDYVSATGRLYPAADCGDCWHDSEEDAKAAVDKYHELQKTKMEETEDKAELRRQIEVMQAALNGEAIQAHPLRYSEVWVDSPEPGWDWIRYDYRVKPKEPRTIYLVTENGTLQETHYVYLSEEAAQRFAESVDEQVIEFVEVQE